MAEAQQILREKLSGEDSRSAWIETRSLALAAVVVLIGFIARLCTAWGTFLNPDEALHYFIANRGSFDAAYQASLTMAHPPLLIFLLYWLRSLGASEFLLRFPTVLCGTTFCWIFFLWLSKLLGRTVGLVGLIFVALLPPMVSLTAQVRQYGLLLLFLISGAYLLELAFERDSPALAACSSLCFYVAMLSHYSAFLFVASIGFYALLRFLQRKNSLANLLTWCIGQIGALALVVFLYVTHISKIKGTTMAEQAFDGWLRKSYFHHGDNILNFLATRTFSIFQYMFGQLIIGDLIALLFVAGIVWLLRKKPRYSVTAPSILAALIVVPFVLNYALALFDFYPYGGTRHCMYLAIFAIPAIALCVERIARENTLRAIVLAVGIVLLSAAFRTNHAPYIARADQNKAHMDRAMQFIRDQVPGPILVDYESGIELGHYLCKQRQISYEISTSEFLVFTCDGRRIISTITDLWAFTPPTFLTTRDQLIRSGLVQSGERIWVIQAGWMVTLDDDLRKDFPEFHDLQTQRFGNNIRIFPVVLGNSVPPGSTGF